MNISMNNSWTNNRNAGCLFRARIGSIKYGPPFGWIYGDFLARFLCVRLVWALCSAPCESGPRAWRGLGLGASDCSRAPARVYRPSDDACSRVHSAGFVRSTRWPAHLAPGFVMAQVSRPGTGPLPRLIRARLGPHKPWAKCTYRVSRTKHQLKAGARRDGPILVPTQRVPGTIHSGPSVWKRLSVIKSRSIIRGLCVCDFMCALCGREIAQVVIRRNSACV
jgi:hypothetical protein